MKVVFEKSIYEKIQDAKSEAIIRMVKIDYIELTEYEALSLRDDPRSPSIISNVLRDGDEFSLMGVKIKVVSK